LEQIMKIAIYQGAGVLGRVDENLEVIRRSAQSAARQGAGFIIFPEMFLTGYNAGDAIFELAEAPAGPSAEKAGRIAAETDIALLYGYPERSGDRVYNSAVLIGRQGSQLANYRKTHLFGPEENRLYHKGDSLLLVNLEGLKIGLLICYDVEFPEAVRLLAAAGADLIAVPTALMKPYCRIARHVVAARAYENEVYVAYVNRCGVEGHLEYCGLSCVIGPDGDEIIRAAADEALLFADIDRAAIAKARRENPVLTDRRPELYSRSVQIIGGS